MGYYNSNSGLRSTYQVEDKWDGTSYQHYIILYNLQESLTLQIGKLGEFQFPCGYYLYVGKDKRNIRSRVSRHISRNKNNRWHIDYLSRYAMPVFMQMLAGERNECDLVSHFSELGGRILISGFGSSDCNCKSHLLYYAEITSLEMFCSV